VFQNPKLGCSLQNPRENWGDTKTKKVHNVNEKKKSWGGDDKLGLDCWMAYKNKRKNHTATDTKKNGKAKLNSSSCIEGGSERKDSAGQWKRARLGDTVKKRIDIPFWK